MNEHMIVVLNKVKSTEPEPVQKSYLYYSQAEKEAVDYMIYVDLLKEKTFVDKVGTTRKGYVLGDFGSRYYDVINDLHKELDIREQKFLDKGFDNGDYESRMSIQVKELDERGNKKMETIVRWKRQNRN